MTDSQILTLAIAAVVPPSLLIYSNSRITDAKEVLRAEMKAGFESVHHAIESLEATLRVHEVEHHKS